MVPAISPYEKYIFYSYLPRPAEADLSWLNCDFECDFGTGVEDESWWIQEGVKALRQAIVGEIASTAPGTLHVLPLSGGLDSRAILAGLLEQLPASQIVAVTYGIPGAWDFQIAASLARKFGIRHELLDLTNDSWDVDSLTEAATRLKLPVSVHQSYVRQKITRHFGEDCAYWSGFMGDALAGSYLPDVPNVDPRQAARRFVNTAPTPNFRDAAFVEALVEEAWQECAWDRLKNRKFTLDQQIDMGVRQNFLHRPLVVPDGYIVKLPFLTPAWGNFMINVPYKWLLGFHLYKRIIAASRKEMAAFPTTGNAGMPLLAPPQMMWVGRGIARIQRHVRPCDRYHSHPRTNYINWAESLRHKSPLQDSVRTTLDRLKERRIFDPAEIEQWWDDHLRRRRDCTLVLMNLSSLELLITTGLM